MLKPIEWPAIDVLVDFFLNDAATTEKALVKMKRSATLVAVETGKEFVEHLRAKLRDDDRVQVVHGSAADVMQILADFGLGHTDCILSGLPFSTLSDAEAEHIISESRAALGSSGIFAAYQMRKAIEPLLRRHFSVLTKGFEWWNIPPCHLYWASDPARHDPR